MSQFNLEEIDIQKVNLVNLNPANNQISNSNYELLSLSYILKTHPKFIVCPFCHSICPTKVEKKINPKNAFCFILSPILWATHQLMRNKDLSCYDSEHYCIKCNKFLQKYESC